MQSRKMSARDQLFGNSGAKAERLPATRLAAGTGLFSVESGSAAGTLREENDRLTDELERKVASLRQATQGIHDEVGEHNRMLSGMGTDFEKTGLMMATSLQRLDGLLRGGGTQGHLCYLALGMASVFLIMYFFLL